MKKIIRRIILAVGIISLLATLIWGTFWIVKKITEKEKSSSHNSGSSNKPNDTPSPSDKKDNNDPNDTKDNKNQNENKDNDKGKTEIKIKWGGACLTNQDYWSYYDVDKLNDKNALPEETYYYIRKNHPDLKEKNLNQEGLVLTLSFVEREVVKRKLETSDDKNNPQIGGTILESGFSLAPNITWEDWPGGFENLKTESVVFVNAILRDGNAIFKHEDPKKDTRFLVNVDNPVIKKLRDKNNLIIDKKYLLTFSQETEYKKYNDGNSDFYYFDAENKSLEIHSAIGGE